MLVSGDISTIELQGRLERATEDMSVKNQEVEDDMNSLLFVCYILADIYKASLSSL